MVYSASIQHTSIYAQHTCVKTGPGNSSEFYASREQTYLVRVQCVGGCCRCSHHVLQLSHKTEAKYTQQNYIQFESEWAKESGPNIQSGPEGTTTTTKQNWEDFCAEESIKNLTKKRHFWAQLRSSSKSDIFFLRTKQNIRRPVKWQLVAKFSALNLRAISPRPVPVADRSYSILVGCWCVGRDRDIR